MRRDRAEIIGSRRSRTSSSRPATIPSQGGLNSCAHLTPPSSLPPPPDLDASAAARQLLTCVPADLPGLRKASAGPLQAWEGCRRLLMAPPAPSAHGASCPCPPAERRCHLLRTGFLPAGPYQGASPSQPAGLKACCGAEAGATHRRAPRPSPPGKGVRAEEGEAPDIAADPARQSGRSCTPGVREPARSVKAHQAGRRSDRPV